ncbi:helix-turn-helix domain-containing protein [Nocardioides humilatus]|uniref:helix-turn-helix domain-containing protein n=1 Tax=Nocardioides humilatus TaxID=2607660 RepID=UPI00165F690F|nr:helix-turn-helix transcriptional regulator [Nocardioides humilatus]
MSYIEHRGAWVREATVREINALIATKKIKIAALSEAAGIPRTTLHNRLHGKGDITVAELVLLAIALDVPAADLIGPVASHLKEHS